MSEQQQSDIVPGPQEPPGEPVSTHAQPKAPDNCPSCGAPLKDVPDVKDACPHCGHEFANSDHFGWAQWHRHPRSLRDTGE